MSKGIYYGVAQELLLRGEVSPVTQYMLSDRHMSYQKCASLLKPTIANIGKNLREAGIHIPPTERDGRLIYTTSEIPEDIVVDIIDAEKKALDGFDVLKQGDID